MRKAIKYIYDANPFYVHWKKHFCPKCGNKLELRYISKIVNSNSPLASNSLKTMRASKNSIEIARKALEKGFDVFVPKAISGCEVVPSEVTVVDNDELTRSKKLALVTINDLMS